MRARISPDHAIPLLAVGGVLLLLFLGHVLEPPLVPLDEAAAREGERVAVEARVVQASGRLLVLADGSHRMSAFAPAEAAPGRGDLVRAEGVVTRLADGPGLSLDRLVVVEPAAARVLRPADLARSPAALDGARVLVEGEPRGDSLVGDGARVRVRGEPAPREAGLWRAEGVFHYRVEEAGYVLRVEAWTRAW